MRQGLAFDLPLHEASGMAIERLAIGGDAGESKRVAAQGILPSRKSGWQKATMTLVSGAALSAITVELGGSVGDQYIVTSRAAPGSLAAKTGAAA